MRSTLLVLALTVFAFTATDALACGTCGCHDAAAKKDVAKMDIVDTAVAAGSFKTLVTAVKAAGLVDTLKSEGPFTVFAPTDRAFAALPAGTVEGLLKDIPSLKGILTYHVVPGRMMAADVLGSSWLETAQGQSLLVGNGEGGARIDNARIIKTDIITSNGIIHVIDAVVLPRKDIVDTAAGAKTFKTLLAAAKAAGLAGALKGEGPFTVFAPNDAAFAKLPEGTVASLLKDKAALARILKYHVVSGRVLSGDLPVGKIDAKTLEGGTLSVVRSENGGVRVNSANVIAADIIAGNGVIHVVDSVILPK